MNQDEAETYHRLAAHLEATRARESTARAGEANAPGELRAFAVRLTEGRSAPAAVTHRALALVRGGGGAEALIELPTARPSLYLYRAAALLLFVPVSAAFFWLGSGFSLDLFLLL